jgi:predicted transglutaminase-like cysteine proteinase
MVFLLCLPGIAGASTNFDRMGQLAEAKYGLAAADTVRAWRAMIEKARTEPDLVKLEQVNDFINFHVTYANDDSVWGAEDYWATPLELFGKGKGDCEDFAIAKYVSLLLMDVPVQKLRLVYVRARIGTEPVTHLRTQTMAHMVLSYFETPTSDPLILDNLSDTISPARTRTDLFPIFSFNHEGLWMGAERSSTIDPTARLSRWRNVLQRMRREGIDLSMAQLGVSWKQGKNRLMTRNTVESRPSSKVKTAKYQAKIKKSVSVRTMSTKMKAKTAKCQPLWRKKGGRR